MGSYHEGTKTYTRQKEKEKESSSTNDFENFEITKEQHQIIETNSRALSILYCAVSAAEYEKISTCKMAKELRDKLEVTYEGTTKVKEAKISALVNEYELFKMEENEGVESMFVYCL